MGKLGKEVHEVLSSDISKAFNFDPGVAPKSVYYPRNIGFPHPAPRNYVEYAIVGKQNAKQEAFPSVVRILEEYRAPVVSLTFKNNQSMDQFVMNVVCDLTNARCPPDELLIRISKSKFVTFAEKDFHGGKIFGSLSFPLALFGGEIRALALDADRMVTMFDDIGRECGPKARETLFEEGRIEGREIVEAVSLKLGGRTSGNNNLVLENAKALFQALGWGRLSVHEGNTSGIRVERATISDPPSDAENGRVLGNYFLQGMVAGILEPFHRFDANGRAKLSLVKELYNAERRVLTFHYMDSSSVEELSRKGEDQVARVLEKVEEVIKSLEQTNGNVQNGDTDDESLVVERT